MMQRYILNLQFEVGPNLTETFRSNTLAMAILIAKMKYPYLKGASLTGLA